MDSNGRYFLIVIFLLLGFSLQAQRPVIGIVASGYRAPGGGTCTGTDLDGNAWDADACTFITITGITDATQKTAVNYLAINLKSNSLWTLADAIYPVVGGNATAHSYNLKNTAAFQLTFSGGWTHSATGMLPNGSTGYANTGWIPSVQSDPTSKTASGALYLRTDVNGTYVDMGAKDASNYYFQIFGSFGYNFYGQPNENNRTPETISVSAAPGSRGFFLINRVDVNNTFIQWNTTQSSLFYSFPTTDAAAPTVSVYLGAENVSGTPTFFSPREIAFAWLGKSLTTTQANTLQSIIQTFEFKLSRQITLP